MSHNGTRKPLSRWELARVSYRGTAKVVRLGTLDTAKQTRKCGYGSVLGQYAHGTPHATRTASGFAHRWDCHGAVSCSQRRSKGQPQSTRYIGESADAVPFFDNRTSSTNVPIVARGSRLSCVRFQVLSRAWGHNRSQCEQSE